MELLNRCVIKAVSVQRRYNLGLRIHAPVRHSPRSFSSVPENRAAKSSRNIRLYFYRFKARMPSGRAPIFFLPGGPGGFYDDHWVKGLNDKPRGGSNLEAWLYAQNRDVVLVNQRGAHLPDKSYQFLFFISFGTSLAKPLDYESAATPLRENAKIAIDQWTSRGMDLAYRSWMG